MSSPTYDQQFDLSQDDIEAFDKIEHSFSRLHSQSPSELQRLSSPSKVKKSISLSGKEKRQQEIAEALRGIGKENLPAAEGRDEGRTTPASPLKDVLSTPQSSFNIGQDDDNENPFHVSHTSLSQSSYIFLRY
jgi:hypothetical protein